MLKQMQRISAEESQPMNLSFQENKQDIEGKSENSQQFAKCEDDAKEEQSKCLLQYIKKQYIQYFFALILIFLAIIAFQICAQIYLLNVRANQYQRNIQQLKEYRFYEQANQESDQFYASNQKRTSIEDSQIQLKNRLIKNTQLTGGSNLEQKSKERKYQSGGMILRGETPVPAGANSLNNFFQFQSDVIQDNLNLSFNAPQVVFQPVQQGGNKQQDEQIPLVVYKDLKPIDKKINYQQFTGITVGQLQQAKLFTQIKFFSPMQKNSLTDRERLYYEDKYTVSQYQQLPICVVIPTYNNAVNNRHINNMNSILMQEYSNYHIVFIDDASTDSTSEDIIDLMNSQKKLHPSKYLLIKNSQQMKAMHNLRAAANTYCQPQDIFIVVDGDDELIGRQVFKLFNAMFQSTGAWFVYSNFLTTQNYVGFSRLIPKSVIQGNNFRKYPFVTSHLRAFYTQLFRNIKEQDLRDRNGEYLKAANDVAICIPILEQAQDRVMYVPEITYFYNSQTGLNNHFLRLKQQKRNDYRLRAKPQYKRLDKLVD